MKHTVLLVILLITNIYVIFPQNLLDEKALEKEKLYKSLMEALQNPEKVYKLSLAKNDLTELPEKIKSLKNLQVLYIWRNNLKTLPTWIKDLKNLTELSCGSNLFTTFPDELFELPHLKKITCNDSKEFSVIPKSIQKAKNLESLVIAGTSLKEIPKEIAQLPNLKYLYLSYNQIKYLPEEIGNLTGLEILEIQHNPLQKIPTVLEKLQNLKELNLSECGLSAVPDFIFKLKNLQVLKLDENNLKELPTFISQLQKLETLKLYQNQIEFLPKELAQINTLKLIDCRKNKIKAIPQELSNKKGLEIRDDRQNLANLKTDNMNFEQLFKAIKDFASNKNIPKAIELAQFTQKKAEKEEKNGFKSENYTKAFLMEVFLYLIQDEEEKFNTLFQKAQKLQAKHDLHEPTFLEFLKEMRDLSKEKNNKQRQKSIIFYIEEILTQQKEKDWLALYSNAQNISDIFEKEKDFKNAEKYILKADSFAILYKKTEKGKSFAESAWKTYMANFYNRNEKYAIANQIYENIKQQLKIKIEASREKDSFSTPKTQYKNILKMQYMMYYKIKKYDSAAVYCKELAEFLEKSSVSEDNIEYTNLLEDLVILYDKDLDYKNAIPYIEKLKNIREKLYGKKNKKYKYFLNYLAFAYNNIEKYEQAEPLYREEAQNTLEEIEEQLPSLNEKEKMKLLDEYTSNFEFYTSFAINYHQKKPEIFGWLYDIQLATKGLLLNSSLRMRKQILESNNENLKTKFKKWLDKKDELSKVYQMSFEERKLQDISVQKLEKELNDLEKEISIASELFAKNTHKQRFTWRDVQKKLKKNEAAVEIYRLEKWRQRVNEGIFYVVLIIKPDTKNYPEYVLIEGGSFFDNGFEDKYLKRYNNRIKNKQEDEHSYKIYWQPIADKLKGIKKVYFSPDGVYNQLSMNALWNPETKKFLIDEVDIQLVNTTKDLLTQNNNSKNNKIKEAVLIGFPDYNGELKNENPTKKQNTDTNLENILKNNTKQRFLSENNITELPGTKIEVDNLENILKKSNIQTQKFTEQQATESLIKNLKSPQILHIATHGFFLENIAKQRGGERSFAGFSQDKIIENPLLRAGLLLAGAKHIFMGKNIKNQEDGVLTAMEACNLELDNTDLVVLSACETGLGEVKNGEGVYGLQRAFTSAGAKSILMSLWTVSDEATQELMNYFYQNWITKKINKKEAFIKAQKELRKKYPEPYYWAAFVLVGE
jgi:CHAT domain-containing protein